MLRGSPELVTTVPAEAAEADLILMLAPAFAHGPLLEDLAPFMKPQTTIGAIPARSGFELQAAHHLRKEAAGRVIFCGQTLPWACRIELYGRRVNVLGTKEAVGVATVPPRQALNTAAWLSELLAVNFVPVANSLAVSLGNIGQVIHPGIMYGMLKSYHGEVWRENEVPLFYHGVTEESAQVMESLSGEIVNIAALLSREYAVDLREVLTVGQWLIRSYAGYIKDSSSLARAFRTNRGYRGLKLPVKRVPGGYIPDFQSRYLTEDVPFGLLFSKAVAAMAGCPTPSMDEVIRAAGRWTEKGYLDEQGNPAGPDIKEARIPQRYGIHDPGKLVSTCLGEAGA